MTLSRFWGKGQNRVHITAPILTDFMVKAWQLRIRISRGEYERIRLDAQNNGFRTLASYCRNRLLGTAHLIEEKIIENNKILKRLETKL